MLGVAEAAPRIEMRIQPGFFNTVTTVIHASGVRDNVGFLVDGCRHNVAGMREVCVDAGMRRAHVLYTSGFKRCYRQTASWAPPHCAECRNIDYTEAVCNW